MPIDLDGWDRALRAAGSGFLLDSDQRMSPHGSQTPLEKVPENPPVDVPSVAVNVMAPSVLSPAGTKPASIYPVASNASNRDQTYVNEMHDVNKYWVEDLRDVSGCSKQASMPPTADALISHH